MVGPLSEEEKGEKICYLGRKEMIMILICVSIQERNRKCRVTRVVQWNIDLFLAFLFIKFIRKHADIYNNRVVLK